ncbi:MAG: CvpA family protein [Lachnospiraceae bacterium]|nr:CvpA family protein [Lachnospiraceae bacterium]
MNFTLIIVFLIIIFAAVHGYKKGITKELSGLISWAVTLFVIALVIMLYTSFHNNDGKNTVFTVIVLVVIAAIYSVVRFILIPAKFIAKLPLFRFLDQVLGFVIGIGEGVLIVWLVYILNESGIFGAYGELIRIDTARSEILSLLYEYNYLIKIAAGF